MRTSPFGASMRMRSPPWMSRLDSKARPEARSSRCVRAADVGAIPLRSGTSGHVVAGYVVRPRFGWSGVGSILSETGWHSAPNILSMPLVPGSGREVPPWVLAGPVIARLRALLEQLKRGFDFKEATPLAPRGTIQWSRYLRTSLPSGRWHQVPCRFPDLSTDPILRGAIRWTLERVLEELGLVAGDDRVALGLGPMRCGCSSNWATSRACTRAPS